jgi:hypothetical protein
MCREAQNNSTIMKKYSCANVAIQKAVACNRKKTAKDIKLFDILLQARQNGVWQDESHRLIDAPRNNIPNHVAGLLKSLTNADVYVKCGIYSFS